MASSVQPPKPTAAKSSTPAMPPPQLIPVQSPRQNVQSPRPKPMQPSTPPPNQSPRKPDDPAFRRTEETGKPKAPPPRLMSEMPDTQEKKKLEENQTQQSVDLLTRPVDDLSFLDRKEEGEADDEFIEVKSEDGYEYVKEPEVINLRRDETSDSELEEERYYNEEKDEKVRAGLKKDRELKDRAKAMLKARRELEDRGGYELVNHNEMERANTTTLSQNPGATIIETLSEDFEVIEDDEVATKRDEVISLAGTEFTEQGFSVRSMRSLSKLEKLRLIAEYRKSIQKLTRNSREEQIVWEYVDKDSKSAYNEKDLNSRKRDKHSQNMSELESITDVREYDQVSRRNLRRHKQSEDEKDRDHLGLLLELLDSTVSELKRLRQLETDEENVEEVDREGWTLFSRLQVLLKRQGEVPETVKKVKEQVLNHPFMERHHLNVEQIIQELESNAQGRTPEVLIKIPVHILQEVRKEQAFRSKPYEPWFNQKGYLRDSLGRLKEDATLEQTAIWYQNHVSALGGRGQTQTDVAGYDQHRKSTITLNVGCYNLGNFQRPTILPNGVKMSNDATKTVKYYGNDEYRPNQFNTLLEMWGQNMCHIVCTQEAGSLIEIDKDDHFVNRFALKGAYANADKPQTVAVHVRAGTHGKVRVKQEMYIRRRDLIREGDNSPRDDKTLNSWVISAGFFEVTFGELISGRNEDGDTRVERAGLPVVSVGVYHINPFWCRAMSIVRRAFGMFLDSVNKWTCDVIAGDANGAGYKFTSKQPTPNYHDSCIEQMLRSFEQQANARYPNQEEYHISVIGYSNNFAMDITDPKFLTEQRGDCLWIHILTWGRTQKQKELRKVIKEIGVTQAIARDKRWRGVSFPCQWHIHRNVGVVETSKALLIGLSEKDASWHTPMILVVKEYCTTRDRQRSASGKKMDKFKGEEHLRYKRGEITKEDYKHSIKLYQANILAGNQHHLQREGVVPNGAQYEEWMRQAHMRKEQAFEVQEQKRARLQEERQQRGEAIFRDHDGNVFDLSAPRHQKYDDRNWQARDRSQPVNRDNYRRKEWREENSTYSQRKRDRKYDDGSWNDDSWKGQSWNQRGEQWKEDEWKSQTWNQRQSNSGASSSSSSNTGAWRNAVGAAAFSSQWYQGYGQTVIHVQDAAASTSTVMSILDGTNKILFFIVLFVCISIIILCADIYAARELPGSIYRRLCYVWRTLNQIETIATRSSQRSRDAFLSVRDEMRETRSYVREHTTRQFNAINDDRTRHLDQMSRYHTQVMDTLVFIQGQNRSTANNVQESMIRQRRLSSITQDYTEETRREAVHAAVLTARIYVDQEKKFGDLETQLLRNFGILQTNMERNGNRLETLMLGVPCSQWVKFGQLAELKEHQAHEKEYAANFDYDDHEINERRNFCRARPWPVSEIYYRWQITGHCPCPPVTYEFLNPLGKDIKNAIIYEYNEREEDSERTVDFTDSDLEDDVDLLSHMSFNAYKEEQILRKYWRTQFPAIPENIWAQIKRHSGGEPSFDEDGFPAPFIVNLVMRNNDFYNSSFRDYVAEYPPRAREATYPPSEERTYPTNSVPQSEQDVWNFWQWKDERERPILVTLTMATESAEQFPYGGTNNYNDQYLTAKTEMRHTPAEYDVCERCMIPIIYHSRTNEYCFRVTCDKCSAQPILFVGEHYPIDCPIRDLLRLQSHAYTWSFQDMQPNIPFADRDTFHVPFLNDIYTQCMHLFWTVPDIEGQNKLKAFRNYNEKTKILVDLHRRRAYRRSNISISELMEPVYAYFNWKEPDQEQRSEMAVQYFLARSRNTYDNWRQIEAMEEFEPYETMDSD